MVPAAQPSQQAVQLPHWRCVAGAASTRAKFGADAGADMETACTGITAPQHFLNFLPLPQGQGSFLPVFIVALHHEGARPNRVCKIIAPQRPACENMRIAIWRGSPDIFAPKCAPMLEFAFQQIQRLKARICAVYCSPS